MIGQPHASGQSYVSGQPVYATGGYGSHVNQAYHVQGGHPALRGYSGMGNHGKKPSGLYVSGYGGANLQTHSTNTGLAEAFTTGDIGDGTTVDIPAGRIYGWDTDFDTGTVFGGEVGYRTRHGWRVGLEATQAQADINTHENFIFNDTDIGILDAATLTRSPTALGINVEEFFTDGRGSIKHQGVFLNGYYDFNQGRRLRPYVGVGLGLVDIDVDYSPSGVRLIDTDKTVLGYQGRIGAAYNVSGPVDVFSEYTYRSTVDGHFENVMFPGEVDVENKQSHFTVGARFNF